MSLQRVWCSLRRHLKSNRLLMCKILMELLKMLVELLDRGDYVDGEGQFSVDDLDACVEYIQRLAQQAEAEETTGEVTQETGAGACAKQAPDESYEFPELIATYLASCLSLCLKAARETTEKGRKQGARGKFKQ
ncbi:hypothetical protein [Potamochoerus porcus polyomavirus 1]|uniref:Agnoprotein n=1 Tax=Potamochoerus porcus polyomavirus 1 TaxID=2170410 RepID=A0A2S1CJH4_9POLY|nr:hypothetical protein [Potamochoerus porcus polyomavirus 1]AWD33727.1 hypothetical protein [Potamochoerus porcus polyomavirus 1]